MPNDSCEIQLTMTVEQASAVKMALDIYTRLGLGQLEVITEMVREGKIPLSNRSAEPREAASPDLCDEFEDNTAVLKALLGYSQGGNNGVGHKHVDITAHRAYEVQKTLAKVLVQQKGVGFGTVDSDGLAVRYTDDPAPKAKIITLDQKET